MHRIKGILGYLFLILLFSQPAFADEFRAFWADAWHSGFKSTSEVTAMVNTAKQNNFNAIIVQVRKRGDCYYFPTFPNQEPRAQDISTTYDPLKDMITQAHANGLKVYAWITTMLVSSSSSNPAGHVMNLHPEWLMQDSTGAQYISEGYYLDPGVPDAMTWNYNVCMDLIQHYDIDGFSLDYIRYPTQDSGYNPTAISRFNAEYGRTGTPSASDANFSAWRRRQVTDFVKKVYANAMAVKPNLVLSASTFASRSDAYGYRFQDWANWMKMGYLDANMPMNYATSNTIFDSRTQDALNYRYDRHLYMGLGCYLNTISDTVTQLNSARSKGCDGMIDYSYQVTNSESTANSIFYVDIKNQVYPDAVSVPVMPWKANPTAGILKGTVFDSSGNPIYNASISVQGQTDLSDPTGFYALMRLTPGSYDVTCSANGFTPASYTITIQAGKVSTQNFTLTASSGPMTISSITVDPLGANSATINWKTDRPASSAVQWGTSANYSNTKTDNSNLVLNHTLLLTDLLPNTQYHFRVGSKDTQESTVISSDSTFTTLAYSNVPDLVIESRAGGKNTGWYSESGTDAWADSTGKSSAVGTTSGIGSRYATFAYKDRAAHFAPVISTAGNYRIYATWTSTNADASGLTYRIVHNGTTETIAGINENSTNGNTWNELKPGAIFNFTAGTGQYVELDQSSGSGTKVYSDAVKFVFVPDTAAPVISNISITNLSTDQCTINWDTDEPATGKIAYGLTSGYGSYSALDSTFSTAHSITLSGLTAGTTYHFQIQSTDEYENTGTSSDQSFNTTFPSYSTPTGFVKGGRWNFISIPVIPSDPTPSSVFTGIDIANANLQYWNNAGGFQGYGAAYGWTGPISLGTPYWMCEVNVSTDKTLTLHGNPSSQDFILSLLANSSEPYWIAFGTPFPSEISADSILFKDSVKRGDNWLSWMDAYSAADSALRIVDSSAQGWDASGNQFERIIPAGLQLQGTSSLFEPWWGYWLLIMDGNEMQIKFTKQ